MTIFLGADHGGYELKEELKKYFSQHSDAFSQITLTDHGATKLDPTDDYPEFGQAVAQSVAAADESLTSDPQTWGILICRSGGGMTIAANRIPKVRAVVCRTLQDVDHARRHNNANVLVLEGDHVVPETAWALIQSFLGTPFDGGRHEKRVSSLG